MRIVSIGRLDEFAGRHPDAVEALSAWKQTVAKATWRSLMDVRQTYSHADGVRVAGGRTITVFNIRGNNYRLLTAIDYRIGVVNILGFLTHAEYDKEKWKGVL
jgi:mRNA interferase HigB